MTGRIRRALPALVGMTTVVVVATLGAGAASAWRDDEVRPVEQGRPVRVRRDAARPDGEVRQGRLHADLQGADEGRQRPATTAWSRPSRRTPASAGTRWPPAPTRPSTARRTTPSSARGDTFSEPDVVLGAGVLQADTIANAAERAGKKVAQIDWVGGAAANIDGPDRRLHQLLLEPRRARRRRRSRSSRRARRSSASPTRWRRSPRPPGWTRRADRRSGGAAEADDVDDQLDLRRPEPEPHLQRLLLRQRRRAAASSTTTRS